jgi:hypothetical protein
LLSSDGQPIGSWERCPSMKENRGSHGLVAVGSGLLLAVAGGGMRANLATCEYLDLRSISSQPGLLGDNSSSSSSRPPSAATPLDDVQADVAGLVTEGSETRLEEKSVASAWRSAAAVSVARHALSVTRSRTHVFATGGWLYGNQGSDLLETLELRNDAGQSPFLPKPPRLSEGTGVDALSETGSPWQPRAPMQQPRRLHGSAVDPGTGRLYVFGGAVGKVIVLENSKFCEPPHDSLSDKKSG